MEVFALPSSPECWTDSNWQMTQFLTHQVRHASLKTSHSRLLSCCPKITSIIDGTKLERALDIAQHQKMLTDTSEMPRSLFLRNLTTSTRRKAQCLPQEEPHSPCCHCWWPQPCRYPHKSLRRRRK